MFVVGHRGAAGLVPENTLKGFRLAIELGVNLVECDVHLTRDGQLVVIHDDRVDRTTDGKGPVRDFSFAEIRRLDAGEGERVPTLGEVLDVIRGRVGLLLELKGEGTEEEALRTVDAAGLLDQVTFTCFQLERIERVRRLNARAATGAIFSNPGADACARARAAGAAGVGIHHTRLSRELVDQARGLGLAVRGWNPDTADEMRQAMATGVDGISTNRPDILLKLLGR